MKITVHNYRQKFKEYYNIDFSNEYDVHHIDLNHDNNDIKNLMLLPKELHRKYHFYLNATEPADKFRRSVNIKIRGNNRVYEVTMFHGLIETLEECAKWFDFKMFLDGEIYNLHNIKFKKYKVN